MATLLGVYKEALRHIGEVTLATITDDVAARRALDDAWDSAVAFVLRQAPWRFALKETTLASAGSTPIPGFTIRYDKPADCLRIQAAMTVSGAKECPIDCRELQGYIAANTGSFTLRYVSSDFATPSASWPEHFTKALAAYLAFEVCERITGSTNKRESLFELWTAHLQQAVAHDAMPEDPWLKYQLDGSFARGAQTILEQGFWRFATVTTAIAASGTPTAGYSSAFPKPADWIRTHAIFTGSDGREFPLDVREHAAQWSANVASIVVRYVSSTAGLDSTKWTDSFRKAVLAFLTPAAPVTKDGKQAPSEVEVAVQAALASDSLAPSPWLEAQLDGRFLRATRFVLERGFWRFALRTVSPSSGGTAVSGLSNAYSKPADWIRTHALFVLSGTRECPVDAREHETTWSANTASLKARYVSITTGLDATKWPQHFEKTVLAVIQGQPQNAPDEWDRALALALDHDAMPANPWLEHQLSGAFERAARFVLEQGCWRFALATAAPSTGATPASGFANGYTIPADWIRTQALYLVTGTTERPLDVREAAGVWSTNVTGLRVRYVSSTRGLDTALWPGAFSDTVLAYLSAGSDKGERFTSVLGAAIAEEAVASDPWLAAQLDGRFQASARFVLEQGFWRFAVTTASIASAGAAGGFSGSFPKPADWARTHAVFTTDGLGREFPVDCREERLLWYAAQAAIVVRYVSTTPGLNSALWPESFAKAVLAYVADQKGFPAQLAAALATDSLPQDPWYRHQISGRFVNSSRFLLGQGRWRFAILTAYLSSSGTPSPGFAYGFTKPTDWHRTIEIYRLQGDQRVEVEFREDNDRLHANYDTLVLRYLSATAGLSPLKWSDAYRDAVLAHLELEEARADPRSAGLLQVKDALFKEQLRAAAFKDDMRERPTINTVGTFTRARLMGGSRSREQGY